MPNMIVPAIVAIGGLAVVSAAIILGRKGAHHQQFKRITSLPVPPRSSRLATPIRPTAQPVVTPYSSRPPVNRVAVVETGLPSYNAATLTPPPPVYNPSAPRSRPLFSLTPNSMARPEPEPTPEQITFPVSRPPSITPFVPSPAPSIRPPSYRSGRSASSSRLPRVGSSLLRDGGAAEAGLLPPRYDLVAAR